MANGPTLPVKSCGESSTDMLRWTSTQTRTSAELTWGRRERVLVSWKVAHHLEGKQHEVEDESMLREGVPGEL